MFAGSAAPATLTLDVILDPATRAFSAVAELDATPGYKPTLHPSLAVRSISSAGGKLRIEYGGTLPPLDEKLDHRGVLGTTPPMASASGTFLPAGGGWYPQPPGLFSYTVRLSLPPDQRGLVAGRLVSESTGERYVAQFAFEHPAEGIALMAGPYVVRERIVERIGAAPLRLRTYFFRDLDALADGYLEDTARYIALYSELIGAYPYAGFSIVASPLPTGFGMPTLTYLGAQVLSLPFIRATSLGHEVLHNWWGNGVYADYEKGNWSEGLTTFMADYFYKERESADAAREARVGWLHDFAAVPAGAHMPLTAFRSRTHGAEAAVGYGKSAMVFFMLRDSIGGDAFARGIRLFWEANRFRVAGWDDLRAAFEKASGQPLGAFFEQWIRRTGGPKVELTAAGGSAARNTVTLTLTQSAPAYALDVPVEIVAGERRETRRVRVERERQTIAIETSFAAEGVRLDPDFRLWRVLEREALPPILRQWIVARAPRLAIESADAQARAAAATLADAFFEAKPITIDRRAISKPGDPVLIVGLEREVDAALASLGLPPRPPPVSGRGSAQIWTIAGTRSTPSIAVISARDPEALRALARPLPHYGAQSYLAFDGAKLVTRGVWPASSPLVRVTRP